MLDARKEREMARERIDSMCEHIMFVCDDFRSGFMSPAELGKMLDFPMKTLYANIALFDKFTEIVREEINNA